MYDLDKEWKRLQVESIHAEKLFEKLNSDYNEKKFLNELNNEKFEFSEVKNENIETIK